MAPRETYNSLFTFKGGDVNLIANYKGTRVLGRVSSQAMVLASPVWAKFLFPPWAPQQIQDVNDLSLVRIHDQSPATADTKQIDCSEDNGEALLVLLNITHLKFGGYLEAISLSNLSNLAILCEQYDCHPLVSPWIGAWIENQPSASKLLIPDPRWLYIAWAFGRQDIFDDVTIDLVKYIRLSSAGEPRCVGQPIREPVLERIVDHILAWRTATIKWLLEIPYSCLDQFHNGKPICTRRSAKCDSMIYGSLAIQLTRVGLWPKVDPKSYQHDVVHLASIIAPIVVDFFPSDSEQSSHWPCRAQTSIASANSSQISVKTYLSQACNPIQSPPLSKVLSSASSPIQSTTSKTLSADLPCSFVSS